MSNTNKVSIDDVSSEIMKYLQEYKEDVDEEVKETADKLAKQAAKELRNISPKADKTVYLRKSHSKFGIGEANWQLPGEYASSWIAGQKSKRFYSSNQYAKVAYNKYYYRLTHLLEFGHANRDGSRSKKVPHIRKTEDKYKEKFIQELEQKIRRGL